MVVSSIHRSARHPSSKQRLVKSRYVVGGKPTEATVEGRTPLHHAAQAGYKDVAELLLTYKAEVNAKSMEGATPLRTARNMGNKDVEALLRQHGGHE
jgi:ankyrin repeat protein